METPKGFDPSMVGDVVVIESWKRITIKNPMAPDEKALDPESRMVTVGLLEFVQIDQDDVSVKFKSHDRVLNFVRHDTHVEFSRTEPGFI